MDMEDKSSADREDVGSPGPGDQPGPVQQDTSAYVADIGPPAAAPPPARTGRVTLILGVAVVALVAFWGGTVVQKRAASATTPEQGETGAEQGAGHAGGVGGGAQGGADANAVFGRVTRVSGSTIYVTDEQGNVVKVATSGSSRFFQTSSATMNALRVGSNVVVQGQRGSDGSFTANVVTIGGAPGGFFGEGGPSGEASPSGEAEAGGG